jgi:hypothetical protein
MQIVSEIQRLLSEIYDLHLGHDVRDFLVTRRSRLPAVARTGAPVQDEELLVARRDDGLALTLYLDAQVLRRLRRHDPLRCLDERNLADWWTVLEGVSHFAYVVHNARHDREVDRLELELQGEVDKYVGTLWLLLRQSPRRLPLELHPLLFARTRIDAQRAGGHVGLYAAASHQAARFCRRIERGLARAREVAARPFAAGQVSELRRFYRLGSLRKLEHIAAAGGAHAGVPTISC